MSSIYYFAAWTDSGFLLGCYHQHNTIASATACISAAGGYVIADENGVMRALSGKEEAAFQCVMWGAPADYEADGIPFTPLRWTPKTQN